MLQQNKNPNQNHPKTTKHHTKNQHTITTIITITPNKPHINQQNKQPPNQNTHNTLPTNIFNPK